jgi:hypothetical protein
MTPAQRPKDSRSTIYWRIFLGSLSTATLGGVIKLVWVFQTLIVNDAVQDIKIKAIQDKQQEQNYLLITHTGQINLLQLNKVNKPYQERNSE